MLGYDGKMATNGIPKGDKPTDEFTRRQMDKYLNKISGPLIDRIDIHVEVPKVPYRELAGKKRGTDSATMRQQVITARLRQGPARRTHDRRSRRRRCAHRPARRRGHSVPPLRPAALGTARQRVRTPLAEAREAGFNLTQSISTRRRTRDTGSSDPAARPVETGHLCNASR